MNNKINVIVPFYNCKNYLEGCVSSIITQKYGNFHIYFIDDFSNDDSWSILPHEDKRATCIRNDKNETALPNIHKTIIDFCEPDSIVVLCDGDDRLINKNVLSFINNIYNENDCWFQYGQSLWSDGRRGFASKYSEEEFKSLRKAPFRVSHIRSFRAGVYHKIKEQDEDYLMMKGKDGEFYKSCYDVPIVWSLMELSGYNKIYFNDVPLYLYNRENPLNDDKVNQQLQWDIHKEVSKKTPFKKIENYL